MPVEQKKKKRLETPMAAAVAHPLRSRCLVILAEREASPAEIGRELQVDVSNVGYHISVLAETNLIERTRMRPVRGALEHFYRAVQLPIVENADEIPGDATERRSYAETILSIHAANAAHSLDVGTFLERPDHHLTRLAMNVDEAGWAELADAYMALYEHAFEVREAAAERMAQNDEKPVRVVSFQSLFEIPTSAKD